MEDTGAATESEDVFFKAPTTELQLKPIHIIVIIITVLHALAIALWVILFLPGEKARRPLRTSQRTRRGTSSSTSTSTATTSSTTSDSPAESAKEEDKKDK
ncbi:hypothetical protein BWQ96_05680 [Gracilariopsis chorda]|uniref:Transmembrane protein n=1 Tax=Gracilariopsis chorda TaxID=448386 RepID=A0A2V3IQV9_9FLOR|nr:hypothetical protein BWQ96_05680 [Gracilariopsis chorda]|eukprot:PXF44502.1 hypothetical protein BWQ96_05680 [Gracilariopsis chorda]